MNWHSTLQLAKLAYLSLAFIVPFIGGYLMSTEDDLSSYKEMARQWRSGPKGKAIVSGIWAGVCVLWWVAIIITILALIKDYRDKKKAWQEKRLKKLTTSYCSQLDEKDMKDLVRHLISRTEDISKQYDL